MQRLYEIGRRCSIPRIFENTPLFEYHLDWPRVRRCIADSSNNSPTSELRYVVKLCRLDERV